jgi:hypothetical protein
MAGKAVSLVESLEEVIRRQHPKDAEQRLGAIYLRLGRQLEAQWDTLHEQGKAESCRELTPALRLMLDRAAATGQAADWSALNWLAAAYTKIGRYEADPAGGESADDLANALKAYDTLVAAAKKNPEFAPSADAMLAVMLHRAECLRALNRFAESLDQLVELLLQRPNMLEAQIAAAYTYQERGDAEDAKWYPRAWHGGRWNQATGQNLIWGWAKLANVAAPHSQHRETFYKARYNLALCRYRFALKQQDAERRKYLALAENDIRLTAELYPELGGAAWKPRFESLLNTVRQAASQSGSASQASRRT